LSSRAQKAAHLVALVARAQTFRHSKIGACSVVLTFLTAKRLHLVVVPTDAARRSRRRTACPTIVFARRQGSQLHRVLTSADPSPEPQSPFPHLAHVQLLSAATEREDTTCKLSGSSSRAQPTCLRTCPRPTPAPTPSPCTPKGAVLALFANKCTQHHPRARRHRALFLRGPRRDAEAGTGDAQSGRRYRPAWSGDADATQFKENPDSWLLVDQILSEAQYPQTKCAYASACMAGAQR
jgi:hypothetical protein